MFMYQCFFGILTVPTITYPIKQPFQSFPNIFLSKAKNEGIGKRFKDDQDIADTMDDKEPVKGEIHRLVPTSLVTNQHMIDHRREPSQGTSEHDQKGGLGGLYVLFGHGGLVNITPFP